MPGSGLRAVQVIDGVCPSTKIAMLTVSEAEDDVAAALKAGARGYILKGIGGRELIGIVRAVASGEAYVTPTLAASLLAQLAEPPSGVKAPPGVKSPCPLDELTERECQILDHLAR